MENHTDALPSGTRLTGSFGIFEIVEKLGQGGFGITYKADLLVNGKYGLTRSGVVAVKEFFISDINSRRGTEVTGTESKKFARMLGKFERESRLLSGLDHPGICHVMDAFSANGTAYYVMDYYGGGSLDSLIRRTHGGALPEALALRYIREIGAALSYLHNLHLAHLDLKPQNIMLKPDGSLVLIDFGISKMYGEDGQFQTSDTMGGSTPGYAPLEQTNYSEGAGDPHLMDIYALGATLYRMLSGQRPPSASDVNNYGLPLEPLRRRGVSEQTISVIVKAMQPKKVDRYQSVEEMLGALPEADSAEEEVKVVNVEIEKPAQPSQPEQPKPKNTPEQPSKPDKPVQPRKIVQLLQANRKYAIMAIGLILALVLGWYLAPKDKIFGHTDPSNLDLCTTTSNGDVVYFSKFGWKAMSSNEKSKYTKKGVYISGGGLAPFLLALNDNGMDVTWNEAMSRYSDRMPTKAQGEVMADNGEALYSAIKAFGGSGDDYFWTKTEYDSSYAWLVLLNSGYVCSNNKNYPYRVRAVALVPGSEAEFLNDQYKSYGHSTPKNCELCTTISNGDVVYFTQEEWNAVPANMKSKFTKKGIYVSGGEIDPFLLALNDNGKAITWDEAMSLYADSMPTLAQGEVLGSNGDAILTAIYAFGGSSDYCFWTQTESDTYNGAWFVYVSDGLMLNGYNADKTASHRVRFVTPVPGAEAK